MYRCQQYTSGTAIHIHKPLAGCCRTDQRLAGTLHGKLQASAPSDCHISVHLEHIVLQFDLHKLFLGTRRFQTQNTVSENTEIEKSFVPGDG